MIINIMTVSQNALEIVVVWNYMNKFVYGETNPLLKSISQNEEWTCHIVTGDDPPNFDSYDTTTLPSTSKVQVTVY